MCPYYFDSLLGLNNQTSIVGDDIVNEFLYLRTYSSGYTHVLVQEPHCAILADAFVPSGDILLFPNRAKTNAESR